MRTRPVALLILALAAPGVAWGQTAASARVGVTASFVETVGVTQETAFAVNPIGPGGKATLEPATLTTSGPAGLAVSVETSQSLVLKPAAGGAAVTVPLGGSDRAGDRVRIGPAASITAAQTPGLYTGQAAVVANYN